MVGKGSVEWTHTSTTVPSFCNKEQEIPLFQWQFSSALYGENWISFSILKEKYSEEFLFISEYMLKRWFRARDDILITDIELKTVPGSVNMPLLEIAYASIIVFFSLPMCVLSHPVLSHPVFGTLWTVAHQAPVSMGFRQEYWSGLPFPRVSCISCVAGRFFTNEPSESFLCLVIFE